MLKIFSIFFSFEVSTSQVTSACVKVAKQSKTLTNTFLSNFQRTPHCHSHIKIHEDRHRQLYISTWLIFGFIIPPSSGCSTDVIVTHSYLTKVREVISDHLRGPIQPGEWPKLVFPRESRTLPRDISLIPNTKIKLPSLPCGCEQSALQLPEGILQCPPNAFIFCRD